MGSSLGVAVMGSLLAAGLHGSMDVSMMRRILPSDRSTAPGSATTVAAVTPMVFLIRVVSWAPAASAASGEASARRSTCTVITSSLPGRDSTSWKCGDRAGIARMRLLDLAREDIDAADDEHVVGAGEYASQSPHRACGWRQ